MNHDVTQYWPRHLPRRFIWPETTIFHLVKLAEERYPRQPAVHFFGTELTYTAFLDQIERFAGWLKRRAGVRKGDRVMLYMQNSPQWLIAYYGTLRADAIVVPVSPMSRSKELAYFLEDSGARVMVCARNLVEEVPGGREAASLDQIIVATYSDYIRPGHDYQLPEWLTEVPAPVPETIPWGEVMEAAEPAGEFTAEPDDISLLPYTSGSTGQPKACIHTHRTFMHNIAGSGLWHWPWPGSAFLALPPMCHVGGLAHSVHLPAFAGGTVVPLPRWDAKLALQLMERVGIAHASILPTAIIDMLAQPDLERYDLSNLRRITAGGASMPTAVWQGLRDKLGLDFIEGYGLTETAATTHLNPIERPKRQCLGIPFFNTDSRVVDPVTLEPLGVNEPGEIVVRGPQLFKGYWNRPEDTRAAHVEIDGHTYFRTGDVGYVDDEGYYFMTDRAKRMINASGYNVWPAEVESVLYDHPGVKEVCVIGAADSHRGETVKAVIVAADDNLTEEALIRWSRDRMAAYKYPRIIEFVSELPKSPVGKILWRQLQEEERSRDGQ